MRCILTLLVLLAPITFGSGAMANEISVTLDDLAATYARPDADPTGIGVVFVAGSGPTDRNGNSPLGIHANYLKQLSDALVADGASVLRYDKRGIGASKAAMKSEAALRFDEFVDDAKSWADWLRGQNGITCVFMLGHSEGGLVATLVAKQDDLAGLVLLDSPGRPLTAVMREQLSDAPLDKKTRSDALEILNSLEAGQTVADVAPALHALFRPSVQPFLISLINIDPAKRLAALKLPTLIVSGGRDLQVTEADYDALKSARPKADAVRIPDMNHVLKNVVGTDRASNLATYANPDLPLAPALKSAVTDFIRRTDCPTG